MKPTIYAFIALLLFLYSCSLKEQNLNRELDFNTDWKFIRADVENAQAVEFDDSDWRILDLPHDYSIEDLPAKEGIKQVGPFSEESAGKSSTGHVVGGTAWYRKYFTTSKQDEGKIFKILFDGVYMNSDVWINGRHLGNHPYGYTAFAYDLSNYLNPAGQENVIAIQVKNEGENSRWYSGSGIYRNVKLLKTNPIHVDLWGNHITTPKVSSENATVKLETRIANYSNEKESFSILTELVNPKGDVISSSEKNIDLKVASTHILQKNIEVNHPELWSVETPALYQLVIKLVKNNKVFDQTTEKFGIRSIEFSPENGFLLNGKSVLLKGACLHHDNGILGAAAFERAEFRRVETMKKNGFNAIRCAHNPPSKVFLDACDELGMLVINESFDQWQKPKKQQDYNLYFDEWWERDMEAMLMRDRNHPSVIMWSIGNEISERADSSGLEIARFLKAKVKELDATRPVTQAICHFWDQPGRGWDDTAPAFSQMDVHAYNYQWNNYQLDHTKHPDRIIVGTESFPKEAFENWELVEKYPYIIGDFVWTGMDYLGESGIGHTKLDNSEIGFLPPWPWYNAYCGDINILGYKKPQMYFRDVVWNNSNLEMLVHAPVPEGRKEMVSMWGWPEEWKSWNWEGNENRKMQVSVYSRCQEVRLELNGEVVGTKVITEETNKISQMEDPRLQLKTNALTARFEVPYQPGELVAIGINNGKEIARQSLKTTGKPAQLKITSEHETVSADANDLAYFNVEVLDKNGLLVPNAAIPIEFDITGNCELQAVGNGNPADMKSFQSPVVNSFRGKCQLIVRSREDSDEIIVRAKSEGLKTSECKVIAD